MSEAVTIEKLEKNMELFSKMYDAVRLVDPIRKIVIECRGIGMEKSEDICYGYWGSGKICDNCISVRAHLSNKCFMKLEQSQAAIMMVTALPVEGAQAPIVLELLKNASDTMLIGNGEYADGRLMRNVWAELNDMAVRDDLTGLFNRRYVNERLPADIVKAALEDAPLSLIFADVNTLKQINDAFGHANGDLVLTRIGQALQSCIRSNSDWVARYGGDEFVICLGNTDEPSAARVMEEIHQKVAGMELLFDGYAVSPSLALGVHTMREDTLTPEEIITLADRQMYKAKKQGKQKA